MPEIEELCGALGGEPAVHERYVPFSTLDPPWSSLSLTSFQNTIRICPSFCVRITSTSPSSLFFGINQSIRYGTSTSILSNTAGIVDTGTTLTLISTGK